MKKLNHLCVKAACAVAFVAVSACSSKPAQLFVSEIDSISKKWVPDSREGICNFRAYSENGMLILKGETNLIEAKKDLIAFIKEKNSEFIDSIKVLPDTSLISEPWGLITLSVCNIRHTPSQDAEMISQAIMGTPVRVLKDERGWLLIQTPDTYLGWTEVESVETFSEKDFIAWKSAPRLIYLNKTGDIYTDSHENRILSDIVAGCIVSNEGRESEHYRVLLPDNRQGYIPVKYCRDFSEWAEGTSPSAGDLIRTASVFMGSPYLWGGTSAKGMDCSGFVKTVYFINGLILARDVSLQYRHGKPIADFENTDSLSAGDLLFFGSVRNGKPAPTHVGMYIGNTEFIHSSGMVRVNSLDSTRANFSRYRRNTYLGARRIIGEFPAPGLQLVSQHSWYK